jgi:transcriptional regulator with XRE-family HTH domain
MTTDAKTPVGTVFRALRSQRRMTLEEVAGAVGMDGPNLSRVERGLQELPDQKLRALSEYFGFSPADVYVLAQSGAIVGGRDTRGVTLKLVSLIGTLNEQQREQLLALASFLAANTPPGPAGGGGRSRAPADLREREVLP